MIVNLNQGCIEYLIVDVNLVYRKHNVFVYVFDVRPQFNKSNPCQPSTLIKRNVSVNKL